MSNLGVDKACLCSKGFEVGFAQILDGCFEDLLFVFLDRFLQNSELAISKFKAPSFAIVKKFFLGLDDVVEACATGG